METLVEQPQKFEIYDREIRAYHDATTWLAETLNGRMLTSFEYNFDGQELYASDGGALKPIFEKSLEDAEDLASKNPTLAFEKRRRQIELAEYNNMLKMASGELPNTMITVSDFPPELMNASKDEGGYNATRKQTMLRVITRDSSGKLTMRSQSLDGSNRVALEELYASFGLAPAPGELLGQRIYSDQDEAEQEFLVDKLTGVYDHSLQSQNPDRQYRAGRLLPDTPGLETYQFVRNQTDLVDHLTDKMLKGKCDDQTMFSVAATMASRYENVGKPQQYNVAGEIVYVTMSSLKDEMYVATSQARAESRTFSGCGASFTSEPGAGHELEASGFGNKTGEENSWHGGKIKKGKCVNCKERTNVGVKDWCQKCISGHCGSK